MKRHYDISLTVIMVMEMNNILKIKKLKMVMRTKNKI